MGAVEEGEISFEIADEVLTFQGKSCLPFASFTRWLTQVWSGCGLCRRRHSPHPLQTP